MSRRPAEERVVTELLVAAAAILSLLALLLIRGERRRESLLLEYEAERTAGDLLDAFRDGSLETRRADPGVLGFGLYAFAGEPIVRTGSAPAALKLEDTPPGPGRFTRDPALRSITLARPIGPMRPMMGMPGRHPPGVGQPGIPRALQAGAPAFLFLEMATENYRRTESRFRAASVVVPAAIIALAALAGTLYWKNAGYRRRMAAREQLAQLGEVARTLAHEIKNPLGAIRLQTGILRRSVSGEGLHELSLIDEEVARLALLSDRIGAFLRDPKGDPRPLEVGPFIRALLERFRDRVRLGGEPAAAAASIAFDADRLRSVIENLITNALESGGSEPPEVIVSADPSRVEVAVLDRGAGIAPDDRERVFDPFFTRKTQGSGVGLAIARRFVEAAGAELRLEPRPGGGTAARLRAPRVTP